MNAGKSAGGGQRRSSPAPPAVSSRNLQNLTKNNTTIASSSTTTATTTTSLISGAQVQQSISSLESSHKVNEKQQQQQQQKSMHLTTTLVKSSGDKEGALITNVKKLTPLRKQEEEVLSTNFNSTDNNNDKKDNFGRKRLNTDQQQQQQQQQQHLLMNTTNSIKLVTTNTATTSTSGVKKITTTTTGTGTGTVLGLAKNVAVTVLSPIRSSEPTTKRLKIENTTTTTTGEQVLVSEIGNSSVKSIADTTTTTIVLKERDYSALEKRILAQKFSRIRSLKDKHSEHVAELFYLQTSGNMMDYPAWRKKPPTPQLFSFNNAYRLEYLVNEAKLAASLKQQQQQTDVSQLQMNNVKSINNNDAVVTTTTTNTTNNEIINTEQLKTSVESKTPTQETANALHGCHSNVINQPLNAEIKIPAVGATPVAVSTKLPAAVAQLSQQGGTPLLPCNNSSGSSTIKRSNSTRHITSSPPAFTISTQKSTTGTTDSRNHLYVGASGTSGGSNGATVGNGSGSSSSSAQLEFTNKAKQEVYVMQRVSELQREGLWTEKRLPKLTEPSRVRSHWDYLLEEMVWLAADFAQERKWKKNAAKKCAKMVQKYFHDKANAAQKAEKAQEAQLRRVANFISKEVKMFWSNVEKLVEYKHFAKLEEKRKKALDQHLSFIVDQTEKYSQQLAEGMNKSMVESTANVKRGSSTNSSNTPALRDTAHNSDDEFLPASGSEDDEETIAKAEEEAKDVKAEVSALKRESQMEIDDVLKDLPKGYLENRSKLIAEEQADTNCMQLTDGEDDDDDDNEFEASGTSGDDEDTIVEQEKKERNVDYKKEIDELEADNDLSVEQLLQKYNPNNKLEQSEQMEVDSDDDVEASSDTETEAADNDTDSDTYEESDEEIETDAESEENEDGLKTLFDEHNESSGVGSKDDMIKDAAALAESIQPKGNTLSSTNVVTPVPFLLKHSLREYQHIGLDWLVTMYERKLNGILADEMGLGKTIQTIALLAHLACEKGNWGPHLIVVPSSVMLNWEMEFKKWCPGFKILTYYGTQKERKAKRVGWTKPNAFHVCITSYKLVVQDQQSFRRKKWKYLILDEAQNIKNFKSQRWQLLLNFSTERRLLLTGTPLQNDLMELWSLMHFLMPHVFSSHREFKEWFSNPMTGMIEGNLEYNETLISRLHKVIRPFLLRRLKKEVEKQMPSKYEHVIMCRLSNRQRYLYDDFMSRAKTKETLQTGNLLSVINVLMQLRKVCNHPNMFEVRPIISPLQMEGISLQLPGLVYDIFQHDPFTDIHLHLLNLDLLRLELMMTAYVAYKMRQLAPGRKLIEEVDTSVQHLAPTCPKSKYRFHIRIRDQSVQKILSKHSTFQVQVGASPTMKKTEGNQLVPACSSLLPFSSRIKRLVNLNKINPIHSSTSSSSSSEIIEQQQQQQQPPPLAALRSSTEENNKILNQTTSITTMGSNDAQSDVLVNQIAQHVRTSIKPTTGSSTTQKDIINLNSSTTTTTTTTINVDDLDVYNMQEIYTQRKQQRLDRLKLMATNNERRTTAAPIYGADCRTAMQKLQEPTSTLQYSSWQTRSSYNCGLAMAHREETWVLNKILRSYAQRCEYLEQACSNFILFVPKASAKRPQLYVSKLSSTQLQTQRQIDETVQREMSPKLTLLHPIISAMTTQFPDPRLIQYDCGKLQTLDKLLRQLKSGQHRVLIFTQMTKMLDVLEAFLNYHGHIYLRLDGSTRVEQRQLLMERFNGDKRIFCFILSTRSGGVGINLTGADTVIFYDSDWNPTMDAQAQDRCHRIGQTRDVHIYRLVSEKTIEVNILQKANQKRMLSDMAIEGGNFTTTFFKSSTIKDLFNVEQMEQQIETTSSSSSNSQDTQENEKLSLKVFENALAEAEDEQDVQATKTARAEAAADLAEFDETIPIEDSNNENVTSAAVTASGQEMSKVDLEMQNLVKQLSPVERYAMRFVEEIGAVWSEAQLKAAEEEIEAQKREWEANRLAVKQKEEEMLQREAEEAANPEDLLTYSRRDANNQVVNKLKQKEQATNIRKNTNISNRFVKTIRRDSKVNRKKVNCRRGEVMVHEVRKQAQTNMKNRVLNNRRKLAVRQLRRNRRNNQLNKNDEEEQQETSENDDDVDEDDDDKKVTESIEKYSTRSTTSLEKEIPVNVKSKTGVKNQKLLNIARLKQNETKVNQLPTRRLAVVLTNTKRVLRNNTVRQSINKSKSDERKTRTKYTNTNTQVVNFRNKLRSESCRSSENTEEDEARTMLESEQSTRETDTDTDCNGIISNSQENTNSSTTYYNVSEEESEEDSESNEVEEQASDKSNRKVLIKQILKNPLTKNIENETTPRTRSRGTVNIDLWTLDNSILASNSHKKETNEQNNDNSIDKKSKVYLKRKKTDDLDSKPSKLTTLDHWITPTKNGSPITFYETDS